MWRKDPRPRTAESPALEPAAAYALWAPAYPPEPHNPLMQVEQSAMLALLPGVSARRALDAGCGTGRYLRLLREHGATAVGVDRSPPMLARARAVGGRIAEADLRALPFAAASFDVVTCGLVLNDVDSLRPALAELARVLAPGGALLYSTLHPRGEREGWTRTFDTDLGPRAVRAWWHPVAEHRRALVDVGLIVDRILEPALPSAADGAAGPAALVVRARPRSSGA